MIKLYKILNFNISRQKELYRQRFDSDETHKSDIKKQEQQIIDSINEENRILEKKKEMAMHLYRQILEKVSVLRICPIIHEGLLWPWSYDNWAYTNYQCISIRARCTTLCDVSDLWQVGGFLLSPQVSSTNTTDRHDITEIFLKVALNTIKQKQANISPEYILRNRFAKWIK